MDEIEINNLTFNKYLSAEAIAARVKELAAEIENDIDLNEWTFVILLNGAYVFASDLLRCFTKDVETKFIKISSYHDMESSGKVSFDQNIFKNIDGKKLFIIEDIVDTAQTLHEFTNYLKSKNVGEIKICSLLLKPTKLKHDVTPDYLGFSITDLFVVGYGLDFNERGRGLKDLWVLKGG